MSIKVAPDTRTKPQLSHGGTRDKPPRHIVASVTPNGEHPQQFSNVALCGAKVSKLTPEHNGSICQACVEESKRRPKW